MEIAQHKFPYYGKIAAIKPKEFSVLKFLRLYEVFVSGGGTTGLSGDSRYSAGGILVPDSYCI